MPAGPLAPTNLFQWLEVLFKMVVNILAAIETAIFAFTAAIERPAAVEGVCTETRPPPPPPGAPRASCTSTWLGEPRASRVSSPNPSALGAKAKRRPGRQAKPKSPPVELPDRVERVLNKWGLKKIDFGKRAMGQTFEEVRLGMPDYCRWVTSNAKENGEKNWHEGLLDFAKYLKMYRSYEEKIMMEDLKQETEEEESRGPSGEENMEAVSEQELVPGTPPQTWR